MSKYVREIDSIQELRNTPTSDAAAAHVRTPTGQGGVFVPMDADPFARGDDGAVALQASDGAWWVREKALEGESRPEWWGAQGDGVTDDTEEIQNAVDFAGNTGAVVKIKEGTYFLGAVKNDLSASNSINASYNGIAIRGEGPEATKFVKDVLHTDTNIVRESYAILVRDVVGVSISGLGFNGERTQNKGENSGNFVKIERVNNDTREIKIRNIKSKNAENAVKVKNPSSNLLGEIEIQNIKSVDNEHAILMEGASRVNISSVFCREENYRHQRGIFLNDNCQDCNISNVQLKDIRTSGFQIVTRSSSDGAIRNININNVTARRSISSDYTVFKLVARSSKIEGINISEVSTKDVRRLLDVDKMQNDYDINSISLSNFSVQNGGTVLRIGATDSQGTARHAKNISITEGKVEASGQGIFFEGNNSGARHQNVFVSSCNFKSQKNGGIFRAIENSSITNNSFDGNFDDIDVASAGPLLIKNNHFLNNSRDITIGGSQFIVSDNT